MAKNCERKKTQQRVPNDFMRCSYVCTCYLNKQSACRLNRLLTLQKERRHCSTAPIPLVVRSICGSAAARLLGSRVRIPLKAQMFVSFVYSALLRYRPYWVCVCIIVCVLQASTLRRLRAKLGCTAAEFGVTWLSNCIQYWAANTNNNTVFIMCGTLQATAPGHRNTTIVQGNTTGYCPWTPKHHHRLGEHHRLMPLDTETPPSFSGTPQSTCRQVHLSSRQEATEP